MTPATHPADISSPTETGLQLSALLHRAGIARLDKTGWIRVTGSDRARWLNGMASNTVQALADAGAYNFFLNAQGRIQGDGYIFTQPDALLLETQASQIATLIPWLDHYIIMDDVELTDISADWSGLTIIGPDAASLLAQIGIAVPEINPLELREVPWNNTKLTMIHAHSPLVPRYEFWTGNIDILVQSLQDAGAVPVTAESLEHLRILEGTPRYSVDIRDRDLPQETAQTRALHFSKGCYLGQEIVERIRSRGNVHRTFSAFRLEGDLPSTGTPLEAAGKQVGEITSVAMISLESAQIQLALGYARREALDRGDTLTYPGGIAVPVPSPYLGGAKASQMPSTSSERKD
jgi:folate-binding protein YgfZ